MRHTLFFYIHTAAHYNIKILWHKEFMVLPAACSCELMIGNELSDWNSDYCEMLGLVYC